MGLSNLERQKRHRQRLKAKLAGCEPEIVQPALLLDIGPDCEPLDFMLAIMRDPAVDLRLRAKMAELAAPYRHARLAPQPPLGKKDAQQAAAAVAGAGRYAPGAPPKLVTSNK